ncbi:ABC transporter substrate-binding protein [Paratractidigestivibacter sp.]|uniref:ABC transporter substrate-binding protein n=1 Tax=Paratractidigestivibacter sp. TaxID=2847316 RepID=UPI002AC96553|nr:ABC transporter substrate-binding protein [Paratractidigestivibacter sp.]
MSFLRTRAKGHTATLLCTLLACVAIVLAGCGGTSVTSAASAQENYVVDVQLSGGSGRASVSSPCTVVKDGDSYVATLVWSSSSYDKMTIDGKDYVPTTTDPGSTFEIPIKLDCDMAIQAETTAMSEAHTIEYVLRFDSTTLVAASDAGNSSPDSDAAKSQAASTQVGDFHNTDIGCGWQPTGTVELAYATHFTIDAFEGGYKLICVSNGERFLMVPEGGEVPDGLSSDISAICLPANRTYLVSSSTMCLIDAIGAIDNIKMSATKAEDCSVAGFAQALQSGAMVYGGKYSAPDYERIASEGITLAIENNMINHNPDVKEKLISLGLTVLTEQSSLEGTILGRLEWVKLYGVLFGSEDKAEQVFEAQRASIEAVAQKNASKDSSIKVAYFYINSNGAAVTRRSGDYVAQMVRLAGGTYALDDTQEGSGSTSSVALEMEQFFLLARDADVIIYSSSIDDSVHSIDDLVAKNNLLSQFKAVQSGNVWSTGTNIYQQMTSSAEVISELSQAIEGSDGQGFTQLTKLN